MNKFWTWAQGNSGKIVITAVLSALSLYLTGQTNATGAVGMVITSILPGLRSRQAPVSTPNPRANT